MKLGIIALSSIFLVSTAFAHTEKTVIKTKTHPHVKVHKTKVIHHKKIYRSHPVHTKTIIKKDRY